MGVQDLEKCHTNFASLGTAPITILLISKHSCGEKDAKSMFMSHWVVPCLIRSDTYTTRLSRGRALVILKFGRVGIQASSQIFRKEGPVTFHRIPCLIASLPANKLLHPQDCLPFWLHSRKFDEGKYLPFNNLAYKDIESYVNFPAYFANNERLNRCKSLNPNPLSFLLHERFFQLIQWIFEISRDFWPPESRCKFLDVINKI